MTRKTPRAALRVLHLHSTFRAGGKETRSVALINAFGRDCAHTIVSAEPGALDARAGIDRRIAAAFPEDFPALAGPFSVRRLNALAAAMAGFDLVLTYNWGAMDAVMAHTLFGQRLGLPPLVHHEDGFNADEARRLKRRRNWYRTLALARAEALVVPSARLERIALTRWRLPRGKVHRIANGVDVAAYAAKPRPDALPRVIKRPGELWLGTMAGLRAVKNLPRLVRAFAPLPEFWQLVIVGEGPEREAIREEAVRLGVGHRVHLPGFAAHPERVFRLFDLFALSSDSEQAPISVVEAMAAGLAVAAPDVGDIAAMVAAPNRRFITPPGDEAALAGTLAALAADPALRSEIGAANRARAEGKFTAAAMIARYRALYARVLGRSAFP